MIPAAEKILVIIPTYNEAENLPKLVREIVQENLPLDLLVIDDHSPDGTGQIAERLKPEAPVTVLHRSGKLGIGSAHKEGFRYAIRNGYPWAITMDADFAHSPHYLKHLLEASQFAEVVVGSRYIPGGGLAGWSWPRRILTHTAHGLTTALLGIPYDCTGGFRIYSVSLLKEIYLDEIQAEGYAFLIELLFHIRRKGHTVGQIPIVISTRHQGKSKISRSEILKAIQTLLRLSLHRVRTPVPVRSAASNERTPVQT